MKPSLCGAAVFAALVVGMSATAARAQLPIVGNDEKITIDPDGKQVRHPPGKDTVSILDIHDRAKPKVIANLPMMNRLIGPPATRCARSALWRCPATPLRCGSTP